jgi:hypothetical protein
MAPFCSAQVVYFYSALDMVQINLEGSTVNEQYNTGIIAILLAHGTLIPFSRSILGDS